MTNEELFTDLKQFIEATVSQAEQRLEAHMATKDDVIRIERRIGTLDEKLDTIQDAIADTLTHTVEDADARFKNQEQRLRRLEHRAA